MIIRAASKINRIIFSFFIALLLLLTLFYLALLNGIEIKTVRFPLIKMEKFYLKLDKKLILKIDSLYIKKKKEKSSKSEIGKFLTNIKFIPKFFQEIEIKKLKLLNSNVTILYNNGIYFIDTDIYSFATKLHLKNKKIFLNIPQIYLKKSETILKGKGVFDLINNKAFFTGRYNIEDINGSISLSLKKKILKFKIDSSNFTNSSLKKVTNLFSLNKYIKEWIYKKIVAKKYKLEYLVGKVDLNSPKLNLQDIYAKAFAYDVEIKFNKKLPPVKSKKITISLKNNALFFELKEPKYLTKNLDKSFVVIKNLTNHNPFIDIVIKTKAKIDKEIQDLLKTYNIALPLSQKKGIIDANLKIRIALKSRLVTIDGIFLTNEAILTLGSLDLFVKKGRVRLKNSKIFIDPSHVALDSIADSLASGEIDISKKIANLKIEDSKIKIAIKDFEIFNAKDLKDNLVIDFSKDINISLKKLQTTIKIGKESVLFYIQNLKSLETYSKPLQESKITKGDLLLATKDFKSFKIESNITKENNLLYEKNKNIKNFSIKGEFGPNRGNFSINKGRIKIIYKENPTIYINGYDIKITKLTKKDQKKSINFNLIGIDSTIELLKHKILSEKYNLKYKNGYFEFINFYKESITSVKGSFKNYKISAEKLNDEFIKKFLNIDGIYGGKFFLEATGSKETIKGNVKFYNTTLKDLAILNNIFAFLNTIPSLVTFSDPGYSSIGYRVKKGEIDFLLKNSILQIRKIDFTGKSLDIEGFGVVNLSNYKIDLNLTLKTFKKISNILDKIPVAGYLFLGKDGSILTKIKIKGSLIKPRVISNIPKEIINAPVNFLKRAIELPFSIFE